MIKKLELFLFSILVTNFLFASDIPNWWYKIDTKKNQIIGYGEAKKLEVARQRAQRAISEEISTKVESSLTVSKEIKGKESIRTIKSVLKTSTSERLTDLRVLKSAQVNNKWYIALSYDWTPFAVKFKKKLIGYKLVNEKQNDYFKHTPLVKSLNVYQENTKIH